MRWFRRKSPHLSSPIQVTDVSDPFAILPDAVLPYVRRAYLPQTEDASFGSGSGFGGVPHLAADIDHPACPNCGRPMPLLAQLAIDALPADARPSGEGLLQAFYCDDAPQGDPNAPCEVDLEGWRPFSRASVVRLVPASGDGSPARQGKHPARRVVGWDVVERDLPGWEEAEALGIEYGDDVIAAFDDTDTPLTAQCDKLGGWPAWVQGVDYPDCPRCGQQMHLVLQIDSEDHVPVMFGDMGTGHVTQCRAHSDVLAFGWACS